MFAWSRTWYAEKDGIVYNFDMKKQRDECCREYGFRLMSASEAYEHYPQTKVPWQTYDHFKTRLGLE